MNGIGLLLSSDNSNKRINPKSMTKAKPKYEFNKWKPIDSILCFLWLIDAVFKKNCLNF